jgi:hypothetical protein
MTSFFFSFDIIKKIGNKKQPKKHNQKKSNCNTKKVSKNLQIAYFWDIIDVSKIYLP